MHQSEMLLLLLLLLASAAAVWLLLQQLGQRQHLRRLPGPSPLLSLPLVGHGYMLGSDPVKNLSSCRLKYGDIFRLDVGDMPTIFICGFELISKATKSEAVAARPFDSAPVLQHIQQRDSKGNAAGVSMSSGRVWQEQRRFMLHNLNDLAMASEDAMEAIISQEADSLTKRLYSTKETQIHGLFLTAVNNVIWRITTGKATKQDDEDLIKLTKHVTHFFKALDPGTLINLLQFSSPAFLSLCSWLGLPNLKDSVKILKEMLVKEVFAKVADENGDFIERFLAEVEKNENNEDSSFHGKDGRVHLVGQMLDLFVAGTDTVSTFLEWTILYMCHYTEVQERVHREIVDCFGTDGSISLKDDFRLPYLMATLEEISRHCPETALSLSRETGREVELGGYLIPKGIQIYSFGASVHKDSKLFPDPEVFNPERFLHNGLFRRDDRLMLFGYGRRKCVGEKLARAELFLFSAVMMQKFRFKALEKLDFEPNPGLLFYPKPFRVSVEARGK